MLANYAKVHLPSPKMSFLHNFCLNCQRKIRPRMIFDFQHCFHNFALPVDQTLLLSVICIVLERNKQEFIIDTVLMFHRCDSCMDY